MTVFGYCALTPKEKLIDAGAHHTFERMSDLPQLLFPSKLSAETSSSRT
jgi:hypothetical protein